MLTREDIVSGLRALDLQPGDRVLVHSSLAALGEVKGGADTLIDALLEAVGPTGLVAVPTFACAPPFDRRTSATPLGAVAQRLWRRPEAVRSLHPTHSLAAIGQGAADLVRDHEKCATAYGEGTPYYRLAMAGGKILLLGCDQDRNTTLHTAEAMVNAPYLKDIEATYIADDGTPVNIKIAAMAGPHRDFIGLDRLFLARGVTRLGRIGKAVCRLMDARRMLEVAMGAIGADPAAALCDNPACADCVMQRGMVKAVRLAAEDFTLVAVTGDISDDWDDVLQAIRGEGVSALELTVRDFERHREHLAAEGVSVVAIRGALGDEQACALAKRLGVPLVVPASTRQDLLAAMRAAEDGTNVLVENEGAPSCLYADFYREHPNGPPLAFNPGRFAAAGEKPFLGIFYRGVLRKKMARFCVDDATFDGTPALPGRGNGEVKEIISMLRCRAYDGVVTLRSRTKGVAAFREAAAAFWRLLDTM